MKVNLCGAIILLALVTASVGAAAQPIGTATPRPKVANQGAVLKSRAPVLKRKIAIARFSNFVCPNCEAVNRGPEGGDPAAAQFGGRQRSTKGGALLVDVWAPSCGWCRAMAPQFAAAAARLEPSVSLLKLNSEAESATADSLGVSAYPTLVLFVDGREVARHAGLMNAAEIESWTRQALAGATV